MLRQSAESLAGRIAYVELSPLVASEVDADMSTQDPLWVRGGFPESFLADDEATSVEWRQNFIRTYLERDIPQLGPRIPAETLRRLWTMLAHEQGTTLKVARLAAGLGVSGQTIARYLDLLSDLLLVRRLPPTTSNLGKRLVRSPKVYVRDSGLVHSLLGIRDSEALVGHPVVGASWEGFVLETLLAAAPPRAESAFYRTSAGAEVGLVLTLPPGRVWAVEIRRSLTPRPTRGFYHACEDLQPERRWIVYPGEEPFTLARGVEVTTTLQLAARLRSEA